MAAIINRANFKKTFGLYKPFVRAFSSGFDTGSTETEKSINQITLLGRVGGEPECRGTEENPVTLFSLATNTTYKDEVGEYKQKTEWHRICVFNRQLRELVYNSVRKGQRCFIQGKIKQTVMEDHLGVNRQTTSIIAEEIVAFPKRTQMEDQQSAFHVE